MTLNREQVVGDIRECVQMQTLTPDLSIPQDPNEYIKQLRQQLDDLHTAAEHELKPMSTLEEARVIIAELQCSKLHRLATYRERDQLRADVEARDRTIAAMAARAMTLVPGCTNVDEAWAKLATVIQDRDEAIENMRIARDMHQDKQRQLVELTKEYKDCGLRVEQLDMQITYLQGVSTEQVKRIRELEGMFILRTNHHCTIFHDGVCGVCGHRVIPPAKEPS